MKNELYDLYESQVRTHHLNLQFVFFSKYLQYIFYFLHNLIMRNGRHTNRVLTFS